ncbi:MAG: dihydropteridine reductase [Methanocella sp. PtaU1.Bin125]|nr:MAG: dihydropteridine reductase [Methanocella sp. PtaU1.Bin125]
MDFYDVVKNRKSVRSYKPDKVPEDVLLRILEAARLAPSWANKQCWRYVIVDDPGLVARIAPATVKAFGAPTMIALCADPAQSGQREGKDYYLVDAAISMEHLVLAAAAEGLGTCWVAGRLEEAAIRQALGVPESLRVVAITPLGYPAEGGLGGIVSGVMRAAVGASSRKPLSEIAFHNQYGTPLTPPGKR